MADVNIKQLIKDISLNTKGQYMKETNTLAPNVTIKELQKEIWVNTKEQYMKESNTPCGKCDYQASHKRHLAEHQRAVHERVKYPCSQ